VIDVAAGNAHSVALKSSGQVVCWGSNGIGQSSVPLNLPSIRAIAAGGETTVALDETFVVHQWGSLEAQGQGVPSNLPPITRIAAGGDHALALSFSGLVYCWGWCQIPSNLSGVRAIAAGGSHSIALTTEQRVLCWGWNDYGQCNVPATLSEVVAIAGGVLHTAALRSDGTVVAWGYNNAGQSSPPPQAATRQLSLGLYHSMTIPCGVDIDLRQSPDLGSIGFGAGKTHTFNALPPTSNGNVTLEVIARGDLDLASEYLIVTIDGHLPGTILFSTLGAASDCPVEPNRATITISA
jgi:hypothetical protein